MTAGGAPPSCPGGTSPPKCAEQRGNSSIRAGAAGREGAGGAPGPGEEGGEVRREGRKEERPGGEGRKKLRGELAGGEARAADGFAVGAGSGEQLRLPPGAGVPLPLEGPPARAPGAAGSRGEGRGTEQPGSAGGGGRRALRGPGGRGWAGEAARPVPSRPAGRAAPGRPDSLRHGHRPRDGQAAAPRRGAGGGPRML